MKDNNSQQNTGLANHLISQAEISASLDRSSMGANQFWQKRVHKQTYLEFME